jgi:hypothetical protein
VVAHAPATQAPWTERQLDAAASRALRASARAWALTAAAVVAARVVVVVAQPEEPDQPDDEQAHVEDAEADHEDPPLGGHGSMLARLRGRLKGFFRERHGCAAGTARGLPNGYPAGFVTWLLGT